MGRLRGCIWLTAGLVVALLAGFVGFSTLQRATAQRAGQTGAAPEVQVVVAAHAVPIRGALKAEDLALKSVPVNAAPEGSLRKVEEATGKVTLVDLYAGETLLQPRLIDPQVQSGDGRLALVMAPDQVLMAFPTGDLLSKAGVLKPGDHVDLLFTLKFARPAAAGGASGAADTLTTWNALQNVTISAMVASNPNNNNNQPAGASAANGILLTVSPQDALTLKYLKDNQATLDMVLRAPGSEQPFTTEPVDNDYMVRRYQIPAGTGR